MQINQDLRRQSFVERFVLVGATHLKSAEQTDAVIAEAIRVFDKIYADTVGADNADTVGADNTEEIEF